MLEWFTETYHPDNRVKFLRGDSDDDIIVGGTVTHIFTFPFRLSEYANKITITYRQGLETVIEKDFYVNDLPNNISIKEEYRCGSTLTLILQPEETILFSDKYLNTEVQVEIITKTGDKVYNTANRLIIRKPISEPYVPVLPNQPYDEEVVE